MPVKAAVGRLAAVTRRYGRPLRYALTHRLATRSHRRGGPRPIGILLVSDGAVYTSEQQFAPFVRFARELRRELGVVVRFVTDDEARRLPARTFSRFDIVGLKFSFRADRETSHALASAIQCAIAGTITRLFYFDGDDDLNVLRPDLLALCDRYVKKHVYRDRAEYGVARIGKSNLTDWVARENGRSFADNEISATPPLEPALAPRITVGWNIALDDKIAMLARTAVAPSPAPRPVDISSRAVTSPDNWIFSLRDPVACALDAMASRFRVLVPRGRVGQEEYYAELKSSTICVSPFGYGEICWRDFEAILCGCLLVKPDMGHVETMPDIFVPGVTYVPVRWDYSDLEEVCARYLADHEARDRIIANAWRVVMEAQTAEWFIARLRAVIAGG